MPEFSFTDLNRRSGEILDAAMTAPIALTKQGKVKLVALSVEEHRRLTAADENEDEDDGVIIATWSPR